MSKFDTSGSYFAPMGYMRVNAGGSHEENPNGGVQVGMDEQGVPNMLEEGEPVYNDYVYSDNIVADEEILKKNNIPTKYAGKLYSVIADTLVDDAAEMPLDPIANNGLNAMLVRLADAQEEQKAIEQQKELEKELEALSPEELAELEQMLAAQEQQEAQPVEAMSQEVIPQAEQQPMAEQMYMQQPMEQPMMACGGHMKRTYWPGGPIRYNRMYWPYENAYNQFEAPLYDGTDEPITPILQYDVSVPIESFGPKTSTNTETGYTIPAVGVAAAQQAVPIDVSGKALPRSVDTKVPAATKAAPVFVDPDAELADDTVTLLTPYTPGSIANAKKKPTLLDEIVADEQARLQKSRNDWAQEALKRQQKQLPTWPRYAGAVTSGLLGLYNAFQKPDKYKIPRFNPVLPYGRMHLIDPVYNPIDQNQVVNSILASSAGTARAALNSGMGPSVGQTLLALDANTGSNLGNALAQIREANNQRKNAVIAAHNQNASTLGNFHYGQNRERAQILNNAALTNLQNDLYRQLLNYEAEAQKYAAVQNQIDNVAQALAAIGQENFAMNQLNSNAAFNYGVGRNGIGYYKGMPVLLGACGGKLKKK